MVAGARRSRRTVRARPPRATADRAAVPSAATVKSFVTTGAKVGLGVAICTQYAGLCVGAAAYRLVTEGVDHDAAAKVLAEEVPNLAGVRFTRRGKPGTPSQAIVEKELAAPAPAAPVAPLGEAAEAPAVRYGPMNAGPLAESVASTFRGGSYSATTLAEETTLYRTHGGSAGPIGSYWTRVAPTGPAQAQIDLALAPSWGNTAANIATIRVPAGTTIFEGFAAPQATGLGGPLLGGGSQVFIPNVNPEWLVP